MEKTVYRAEYAVLLELLHQARKRAGVSQVELARRLNRTQAWVSKSEIGERRLDLLEVRDVCVALDLSFSDFIAELELALNRLPASPGDGL
jgi:transcriptional regulator with XRE-family HTH domain